MVGVEATAFVLIGSVEYLTRSLFWNDQVIRSNEFHTYFRVNSVFWDPNVYGRYLALVIVVAMAALLWVRERRDLRAADGAGRRALARPGPDLLAVELHRPAGRPGGARRDRWSWKWTLAAVAVGIVAAALAVVLVGGSRQAHPDRLNVDISGRGNLVSGGLDLFTERPIQGYGSGSFQDAYRDHRANKDVPVSVSHTEPVTDRRRAGPAGPDPLRRSHRRGLWTMTSGTPRTSRGRRLRRLAARSAVLAAFVALLVHTMAYAGFFEDPITWVLLADRCFAGARAHGPRTGVGSAACRDTCADWRRPGPPTRRRASSRS